MSERGFTLLEVMVALMVFSIAAAGVMPVFLSQLKYNTGSEERSEAIAAAQYVLDEMRLEDPTLMEEEGTRAAITVTVNGHDYVVTPSFCENEDLCTSDDTRHIAIRVRDSADNELLFDTETVYTRLR